MRKFIKRLSGMDKKAAVNIQDEEEIVEEELESPYAEASEDGDEYEEEELEEEETDEDEWPAEEFEEGQLSIDVFQTPVAIVVKSTIAGVKPGDIDISINNDMLTIRGKRHHEDEIKEENYLFRECYWGSFSRSIILPVEIESDKIDACLENGVLTVTLPKAKNAKQISIKVKRNRMILKLIVDRFEGDKAVLKTEDNNSIIWPKNKLPEGVSEGGGLIVAITGEKKLADSSKKLAKDILNEIMSTDDK